MNQRDPEVQLLLRRLLLGALAAAIVVCAAVTLALLTLNVDLLDAVESFFASAVIALAIGGAAIWSTSQRPIAGFRTQLIVSIGISLLVAVITIALPAFALFSSSHDVSLLVLLAGFGAAMSAIVALISIVALSDAILRLGLGARRLASGDLAMRIRPEGVRETRETAAALNAMAARFELSLAGQREIDESRRRLIAAVSNDLRGPLSSLRTAVQVAGAASTDPRVIQHSLRMVDHEAAGLSQLIDDLAEMDRIDAGQTVPQLRPTSLANLILETLERTKTLAGERQLALHSHLDRSLPPFLIDEDRIRRVLQHLLQSAIQQTPPGGTVAVELHDQGHDALVNVVCEGDPARWPPGMAESAGTRGADGMGMAIARRLVELHHGRCWVVLPPGNRAVFCFSLPKLMPPPEQL
jgi:signal transduction histidine kinase